MTPLTDNFLLRAQLAAKHAAHIWPEYAACEAALESNWGRSELATAGNNLFGRKVSLKRPNKFGELDLPTKEFLHGEWVHVQARWVKYPDWYSCFADRMTLLRDLDSLYGPALEATTGEDFVKLVSAHWSTDPQRAEKVLEIYRAHKEIFHVTEKELEQEAQEIAATPQKVGDEITPLVPEFPQEENQ